MTNIFAALTAPVELTTWAIQDRLDEVFGPENWSVTYKPSPLTGGVSAAISVLLDNTWRTKEGCVFASLSATEAGTHNLAYAGAFRAAAQAWGVGREVATATAEPKAVVAETKVEPAKTAEKPVEAAPAKVEDTPAAKDVPAEEVKPEPEAEKPAAPVAESKPTTSAPAATGEKTYLAVSKAEKDEAKALGARWDKDAVKWYVPAGTDTAPFAKWLGGDAAPAKATDTPVAAAPVKATDTPVEAKAEKATDAKAEPADATPANASSDGSLYGVIFEGDALAALGTFTRMKDKRPTSFWTNWLNGQAEAGVFDAAQVAAINKAIAAIK